jgi:hypothetical protein
VEGEIDFGFGKLNFGLGWMGEKVGRGILREAGIFDFAG